MSGKNKNEKTEEKEKDCSCYAESHTKKACPPVRNVTHPLRYYEFTPDELKALEECDKESFYQRCLPFSTLFATLTYAAIKYGYLSRSPHFGAVPKVVLAVLFGHLYGRFSYITDCEIKLRQLPANSHLGNVMRQYYLENNPPADPKNRR